MRLFSTVAEMQKQITSDIQWTKSDEAKKLAMGVLNSPPTTSIVSDNMEEYIAKRVHSDIPVTNTSPGFRLLSSLLTFPLTMSYGLKNVFEVSPVFSRQSKNILVVGARAESSLPTIWWRENLYLKGVSHKDIHFVGPGLQVNNSLLYSNPKLLATLMTFTDAATDESHSFDLRNALSIGVRPTSDTPSFGTATANSAAGSTSPGWSKKIPSDTVETVTVVTRASRLPDDVNLLHQHPKCRELVEWADVFVLYNPGYGSKAIQASWEATMKLLLWSKKPVLCTAHGSYDLQRDLAALKRLVD